MDQVTNKLSVVALVGFIISIVGLLLSAVPIINNFAFILLLASLVLGIIGLVKTKSKKARGFGLALAAVIISVVGSVIVFASQAFYLSSLDAVSTELNESIDDASGDNTAEILGRDVEVTLGELVVTEGEYLTETSLPVKVTNKLDESASYSIQIEVIDAAGARIADDYVYANDLGAGQSQDFEAFMYVAEDKLEAVRNGTFKVVSVSKL